MFLAPFTSKSADFYEILRPKGAEKQPVSLRNGPEKQAVSLCNTNIIEFCIGTETCLPISQDPYGDWLPVSQARYGIQKSIAASG